MKQFTFNLQKVLEVRQREEQIAQKDLSVALNILEMEKGKLHALHKSKEDVGNELSEKNKETCIIDDLIPFRNFLEDIAKKIYQQDDIILKAQNIYEKKRQVVVELMKKRKILEKLKEKQYQEWLRRLEHVEAAFIDEQATITFKNRKHSGLHDE